VELAATCSGEEDACGFFVTVGLAAVGDGFDFDLVEAELAVLARCVDAAVGKGATCGAVVDGTTPGGGVGGKSTEDKSEERLGRAELGTTEGAVPIAPVLGKAGSEGTCAGDGDGDGLELPSK
jgi:hypothetical protein